MVERTAEQVQPNGQSECWCCGALADPTTVARLGNHPEVAVCLRLLTRAVSGRGRSRIGPVASGPAWPRQDPETETLETQTTNHNKPTPGMPTICGNDEAATYLRR